jgi:F-type H+-transporting ATPase subunit gamma
MASTRDIRRRIRSVQSTSQLTKAMKMVAAAKLRRAQMSILQARPYALKMGEVLRSLAARANPAAHPLLALRDRRKIEVLVVTGDRGWCGSFNANIFRHAESVIAEEEGAGREVALQCVGRKGRDYFRRRRAIRVEHPEFFRRFDYGDSAAIARELLGRFVAEELDGVMVVYNEFKSAIQQRVVVERLLPIERAEIQPDESSEDYIYEPGSAELFDDLLPRYVEWQVYRSLLESSAAEHAARMTAMEAATRNANEMVNQLTLNLNRVRQASITREIIEVVSGAEALN